MFIALLIILALLLVVALWAQGFRSPLVPLANIGEGVHKDATARKLESAFGSRYLLATQGTAADEVDVCGVSDIPIGVVPDEGAAGEIKALQLLGASDQTRLGVASAAIAPGAFVVAAAGGKLRALPTASGTYYIVGQAIAGGEGADEFVEFQPCVPVQRVVS